MNKTKILVTGTGSLIGQAIIKSINKCSIRNRIEILGADYFPATIGSYWCEKNFILPDILKITEEENWFKKIKKIVEEQHIKIIFVGVDFELSYFSEIKEMLYEEFGCTVVVSDKNVIDIGNDKYKTYEFLKKNNIPMPATYLLDDVDVNNIKYPVIVKPRVGARSRGLKFADNSLILKKIFDDFKKQEYLVQELVGNEDSEYTCGVLVINGECKHSIVLKRKLKEGNTIFAEYNSEMESLITDYILKIANALNPYGSCNMQLRRDNDGQPKLFEINPRFSGTTYMRALFGYNEVEYLICKIMEWDEPAMIKRNGKIIRYYEERLI